VAVSHVYLEIVIADVYLPMGQSRGRAEDILVSRIRTDVTTAVGRFVPTGCLITRLGLGLGLGS
jgi:hypothetical protein